FALDLKDDTKLAASEFYVLMSLSGHIIPYALIVDQDGDPVWWLDVVEQPGRGILMARAGRDHRSILHAQYDYEVVTEIGGLKRTPIDAMSTADQIFTRTPGAHHDFIELPDGRIAYLSHLDVVNDVASFTDV